MNVKNVKMLKNYVIYVVISENTLVTLTNSFQRWGLPYASGGKSAEYVFSFMKLM